MAYRIFLACAARSGAGSGTLYLANNTAFRIFLACAARSGVESGAAYPAQNTAFRGFFRLVEGYPCFLRSAGVVTVDIQARSGKREEYLSGT